MGKRYLFPLAAWAFLACCASCTRPAGRQAQAADTQPATAQPAPSVRPPAVAGQFYPDDPAELRRVVTDAIDKADPPKVPGRVLALIVPHAGYQFSASVAGFAYHVVKGLSLDDVVVMGPSHHTAFEGAALTESAKWRTPLGEVEVDTALEDALVAAAPKVFRKDDAVQALEHSVEVQVPFLQVALAGFKLVPIAIQDFGRANIEAVAAALAKTLKGRRALIVASSDMAHYPARDLCRKVDLQTLANLERMDVSAAYAWEAKAVQDHADHEVHCTLCGLGPVAVALTAARALGADTATRLHYANSGEIVAMTADRSVGYGAMAISDSKSKPLAAGPPQAAAAQASGGGGKMEDAPLGSADNLRAEQKKTLLKLARDSITSWVTSRQRVKPPEGDPAFAEPRAVFVTLKLGGQLRGCIGTLEPAAPLGEAVAEYAIAAATQDPRFDPVAAGEVARLDIHLSVLSPMREVAGPQDIVLGKHGIVVTQGMRKGVFLPEVAPEQGWDVPTTLTVLCQEKAGLPGDAWKRGAKLSVFTTQSFGEGDFAGHATAR